LKSLARSKGFEPLTPRFEVMRTTPPSVPSLKFLCIYCGHDSLCSFALLSEQQIKRGVHRTTAELEAAINTYIKTRNADPKPFRWTKSADDILASIERFCRQTISAHETAA
jgi:hypothetical protein